MNPMPDDLPQARATETAARVARLRDALAAAGAGALRLRGADWFAWVTAGGDAGPGRAEIVLTKDEACIVADGAEAERLRRDGAQSGFACRDASWAEAALRGASGSSAAGAILSDLPRPGEGPLPHAVAALRAVLSAPEQDRCRALGRDAADAVGGVLKSARPDWTEAALRGELESAFLARGIQPAWIAIADPRTQDGAAALPGGSRVTLTCTARRHGLHVGLSRSVAFTPLTDDERNAWNDLLHLEATALDAVHPGQSLGAVYHALEDAYRHADREDAILAHPQGGVTGYAASELPLDPTGATGLEAGMAIALTPGFDGVAIEDTFLLGPAGLEHLTVDPGWPTTTIGGRARPLWLEATR